MWTTTCIMLASAKSGIKTIHCFFRSISWWTMSLALLALAGLESSARRLISMAFLPPRPKRRLGWDIIFSFPASIVEWMVDGFLMKVLDLSLALVVGFVFYNILLWYESSKAITLTALNMEKEAVVAEEKPVAPLDGDQCPMEPVEECADAAAQDSLSSSVAGADDAPVPPPRQAQADHAVGTDGDSKLEPLKEAADLQKEKHRLQKEIRSEVQFYRLKSRILSLIGEDKERKWWPDQYFLRPEKWFEKSKADIKALKEQLDQVCQDLEQPKDSGF